MAPDHDRLRPVGHQARHVLADDWLAKDRAADDVAQGAVRRLVHALEVEFLYARLVRRDPRAFDPDAIALDRLGSLDGDLVFGGVALLHAEIVIFQLDIEIGQDQLVLDKAPHDPRHLVAIEFDDGLGHLDLRHQFHPYMPPHQSAGRTSRIRR
jgi:hypothetical protein